MLWIVPLVAIFFLSFLRVNSPGVAVHCEVTLVAILLRESCCRMQGDVRRMQRRARVGGAMFTVSASQMAVLCRNCSRLFLSNHSLVRRCTGLRNRCSTS